MARGTTKGQVHKVFRQRLEDLQDQAGNLSQSLAALAHRQWQIPSDWGAKKLTDVPKIHTPSWERKPISENYVTCMTGVDADAGTVGDVISLKQQMDYNACEERAFRNRHMTVCRGIAMMHGRRDGHHVTNLFPYIIKQALDAINAGAAPPTDGSNIA